MPNVPPGFLALIVRQRRFIMEKRPPAFSFFTDDWLGSSRISMMSPAEEGAYVRLLCISWNAAEHDCGLPDDDSILATASRLGDAWMNGSGAKLRQCFTSENGRLYNEKLRAEWNKAVAYRKSRSENAKGPHKHTEGI